MCNIFGDDNLIWIILILFLCFSDKKKHFGHGRCRPCSDDILDENIIGC